MKVFIEWLLAEGFEKEQATLLSTALLVLASVLIVVLIEFASRRILLRVVTVFTRKTPTRMDDLLHKHRVFSWMVRLLPPVLLYNLVHPVFSFYPYLIVPVQSLLSIYFTIVAILLFLGALDALLEYYDGHPASDRVPLKSFIQVIKTFVVSSGVIIVIAKLLGTSPLVFFSGLGAFTAVIILIFKDSILGFVAGIQLTTNNLVKPGDWIEMPKYGADGEVSDISLVTVSVQNWDKTITVIPAYALISEGFRNWRGMSESGARRIMRSINIDMQSVQFCDAAMLEKLRSIVLLREYLDAKTRELEDYNSRFAFDAAVPVNGRRLTNLGTFRAYVMAYLRTHPKINTDMTLIVRHMQPAENGIPVQFYVFCNDVAWGNYENVQADIMDHLLAVLPFFGLRVFQKPSGNDLTEAARVFGGQQQDIAPQP